MTARIDHDANEARQREEAAPDPLDEKVNNSQTYGVLKQMMNDYLPEVEDGAVLVITSSNAYNSIVAIYRAEEDVWRFGGGPASIGSVWVNDGTALTTKALVNSLLKSPSVVSVQLARTWSTLK